MGFLGNTERIVTRALAIGFIAVGAGAAHSWLNGPLRDGAKASPPPAGAGNAATDPPGNGGSPTQSPTQSPTENPGGNNSGSESTQPENQGQSQQVQDPGGQADPLPEGHISIADAYNHWENATATFIDTRTASIFAEGHIPGALNLSLEMTSDPTAVNNVLQWITPQDTIILYCKGGLCDESKNVGELLNGAGFQNTLILGDGYPGWVEAGHMTESGGG